MILLAFILEKLTSIKLLNRPKSIFLQNEQNLKELLNELILVMLSLMSVVTVKIL